MAAENIVIGDKYYPTGRPNRVFVVSGLTQDRSGIPHVWVTATADPGNTRLIACTALLDKSLWRPV